jgi:hypothetical protein
MNQAILFNDDISFNKTEDAWCFTGLISGQQVVIYFHSNKLKQLSELDNCTKYDLEEVTELWLENNELDDSVIHIYIK